MGNPALQGEVQQQLHAYGILPPPQQVRDLENSHGETSKRGLSAAREVENPYQELKQLLEGKPSSKKKRHAPHERSPSKERERSECQDESMKDVAPRRRIAQRSPTPLKQKRSPHSPHHRKSKREEKSSRKKKERKSSSSSLSSSPSSSFEESSGYSSQEKQNRGHQRSYAAWKRSNKLKKFKEGGKNIFFLTYDGIFGAIGKVLAFIQQFDVAFGDEGFTESSKLRHIAMHFQKSARQWWASLQANGQAPKTWNALRASIMKQFLASDAKDKVLTKWRSLKLTRYESIHKYVDKFWYLHLKATVYKKIDFEEQNQQLCAWLLEDMNEYVNSQRSKSISTVIHHTMVTAMINFQQGAKRNRKPMEAKDKQKYKGKNFPQNSSKGNSNNNKAKEMRIFKDDIPGELPPKRGDDDHMIELLPGSSPSNKLPYRVSQAQQEKIMRQVIKLVEKGTVKHSSTPFCSPILLVQKKDGTYHEYAIDLDFKDVILAIALGEKEEPFTLQDGYLLHGNRLCITRSLHEKDTRKRKEPSSPTRRSTRSPLAKEKQEEKYEPSRTKISPPAKEKDEGQSIKRKEPSPRTKSPLFPKTKKTPSKEPHPSSFKGVHPSSYKEVPKG
ncbi:hypothetical protein L7F22_008104 [Adiantum nelumboides]|nr:hypothetical protein [Adiantum nelumboides]